MARDLSTTFTGVRFRNPFLLSSAPPTESESNILRAFEAGWGGVVTKTIGLHPVVNVLGPKTKFLRADADSAHLSMKKRPGAALHSSWNWELISDKTLDWWVPRLGRIKQAFPDHVLVASIMAGSGNDTELRHWQELAIACQDQGCDALELNLSCPHMDRPDMGSNVGKDKELVSIVTKVVKDVAQNPGLGQAHAVDDRHRRRGARRVPRRRRRDLVVEHVHVAAADRRRDARLRSARRRPRVDRRPGRPGDPAAVAGEDVAAHAGVSRQELLGHRRHLDVRARAELLPARLRHGAGLHGRDARSRGRPERHPRTESGARTVSREAQPTRAGRASATSSASGATASSRSRRSGGRPKRIIAAATKPKGTRSKKPATRKRSYCGFAGATSPLVARFLKRQPWAVFTSSSV